MPEQRGHVRRTQWVRVDMSDEVEKAIRKIADVMGEESLILVMWNTEDKVEIVGNINDMSIEEIIVGMINFFMEMDGATPEAVERAVAAGVLNGFANIKEYVLESGDNGDKLGKVPDFYS